MILNMKIDFETAAKKNSHKAFLVPNLRVFLHKSFRFGNFESDEIK